jgi:hypothetical protein
VFAKYLARLKDKSRLSHLGKLLNVYQAAKVRNLPRLDIGSKREIPHNELLRMYKSRNQIRHAFSAEHSVEEISVKDQKVRIYTDKLRNIKNIYLPKQNV